MDETGGLPWVGERGREGGSEGWRERIGGSGFQLVTWYVLQCCCC